MHKIFIYTVIALSACHATQQGPSAKKEPLSHQKGVCIAADTDADKVENSSLSRAETGDESRHIRSEALSREDSSAEDYEDYKERDSFVRYAPQQARFCQKTPSSDEILEKNSVPNKDTFTNEDSRLKKILAEYALKDAQDKEEHEAYLRKTNAPRLSVQEIENYVKKLLDLPHAEFLNQNESIKKEISFEDYYLIMDQYAAQKEKKIENYVKKLLNLSYGAFLNQRESIEKEMSFEDYYSIMTQYKAQKQKQVLSENLLDFIRELSALMEKIESGQTFAPLSSPHSQNQVERIQASISGLNRALDTEENLGENQSKVQFDNVEKQKMKSMLSDYLNSTMALMGRADISRDELNKLSKQTEKLKKDLSRMLMKDM